MEEQHSKTKGKNKHFGLTSKSCLNMQNIGPGFKTVLKSAFMAHDALFSRCTIMRVGLCIRHYSQQSGQGWDEAAGA